MNVNFSLPPVAAPSTTSPSTALNTPRAGFADMLGSVVNQVESAQLTAKSAAMDLLTNGKGDVHSVALATQRAELSLELFQQVKNKFVQAYQEIMKMPM